MKILALLVLLIFSALAAEEEIEVVGEKIGHLLRDLRFHTFTKGEIIYVYGSSTSGKSSLVKNFSDTFPEWKVVSTRHLKTLYFVKKMEQISRKEIKFLSKYFDNEEILQMIEEPGQIILPKKYIMPIEKLNKLIRNIQEIQSKQEQLIAICHPMEALHFVYSCAFNLSRSGSKVIIDNLDVEGFYRYMILHRIHCPLFTVLVYCPPQHLLSRVTKRNKQSLNIDRGNLRSYLRPFETFFQIYGSLENGFPIDSICQQTFLQTLKKAHTLSQKQGPELENPLSTTTWSALEMYVRKHFKNDPQILLYSKHPYDILLNSYNLAPAEMIMELKQIKGLDASID